MLLAFQLAIAALSPRLAYETDPLDRPVVLLVGLLVGAGAIYLYVLRDLRHAPRDRSLLAWMIGAGLAMRLVMLPSAPILEDDFYRYHWDGAVTAGGSNPYRYAPEDALRAVRPAEEPLLHLLRKPATAGLEWEPGPLATLEWPTLPPPRPVPADVRRLAGEAGQALERVNHPHIRTIYPPLAQGAFALAHAVRPWSLVAWRCVVLIFDTATLAVLLGLLRTLGLPALLAAVYWWNPLAVVVSLNAAHMDAVALPLVLGAVWLAIRHRAVASAAALALAVGAKVWPVVLLPVVLRGAWSRQGRGPAAQVDGGRQQQQKEERLPEPRALERLSQPRGACRTMGAALLVFAAIATAMLAPVVWQPDDSGFALGNYARTWANNSASLQAARWLVATLADEPAASGATVEPMARCLLGGIFVLWMLWVIRRPIRDGHDLAGRCVAIVAAVLLLSPTGFPWYYLWLLPLLAMRPRGSLLALTALLPLYYLRYHLEPRGQMAAFERIVVWLEFVPVWVWLAWEQARPRFAARGRQPTAAAVA